MTTVAAQRAVTFANGSRAEVVSAQLRADAPAETRTGSEPNHERTPRKDTAVCTRTHHQAALHVLPTACTSAVDRHSRAVVARTGVYDIQGEARSRAAQTCTDDECVHSSG